MWQVILKPCIDFLFTEFEVFLVIGTIIVFTKLWTSDVCYIRLCDLSWLLLTLHWERRALPLLLPGESGSPNLSFTFPWHWRCIHSLLFLQKVWILVPLLVYTDTSQMRRVRKICYVFPNSILSAEGSSVKMWTDCAGVSLLYGHSLPW